MALLNQTMTLPPPKESNFNLSKKLRTDMYIGMATPVYTCQMIPGDIINISSHSKLLTDALAVPCFGQMRLQLDHFFVPYRILWDKWTDFIRQGEDSDIVMPRYGIALLPESMSTHVTSDNFIPDVDILNHYVKGLSPSRVTLEDGVTLPEYFVTTDTYEALDAANSFNLPWINGFQEQEFGYFTYQADFTEDSISHGQTITTNCVPISSRSPLNIVKSCSLVNYLELPVGYYSGTVTSNLAHPLFNVLAYNKIWYEWYRNPQEDSYAFFGDSNTVYRGNDSLNVTSTTPFAIDYSNKDMEDAIDFVNSPLFDNLEFNSFDASPEVDRIRKFLFSLKKRCYKHDYHSSVLNAQNYETATATVTVQGNQFTINQWRQAVHVDKYQKRHYLGGDRYIDWIRAQFGVIDSDARLQRPELLSSISSSIVFIDVESTASTDGANLGQLASRGVTLNEQPESVKFRSSEHGVYMIIASIVPIVDDLYGIDKFSTKTDTFDYFVPALDNIDMQPVHMFEYSVTDDVCQALADDRFLSIASTFLTANSNNYWNSYFDNHELFHNLVQGNDTIFYSPVGYLPAFTEYKTASNRVSGTLSSTRKDYVLTRPNPFHNQLIIQDNKNFSVITDKDGVWTIFNDDKNAVENWEKSNDGYWYGLNFTSTESILIPEFTDNFFNNVYISQYVDFRDFAYLWPDKTGRYPTNVINFSFDVKMRRPMSKWSLPL